MRRHRRNLIATRSVADLRPMDLQKSRLTPVLRQKQHHGSRMAIRVNAGKHLAVETLFQLILWWDDEPAGCNEVPSADGLWHQVFQLFVPKIIEPYSRLPPRRDTCRRAKEETEQKLTPVGPRLGKAVENRPHCVWACPRTKRGDAN